MATIIQIKRTTGAAAPATTDLSEAELAYTQDRTNDGASSKLYIESVDSLSNPVIHSIGGKFYTDIVDGATPTPANFKVGNSATSGGEIQLYEDTDNGSNYTGFKAPDTLAGDQIYVLPTADGNADEVLKTNGSGTLRWEGNTVDGLTNVNITTPASGDLLIYDGTDSWDNVTITGDVTITNAGVTTLGAGTVEFTMFDAATVQTSAEVAVSFGDDDTSILTAAAVQDRIDVTNNAQDLDITDGTTTSAVLIDSQTLTIQGTANETTVEVSGQVFTVGLPDSVSIATELTAASAIVSDLTDNRVVIAGTSGALEDDANLTFDGTDFIIGGASGVTVKGSGTDVGDIDAGSGNFTVDASTGDVVVGGNLTVNGTTTTVNSTTVQIDDPVFEIGENAADDNLDRGIKFLYNDGAAKIGFFGFDDSTGKFIALSDATDSSSTFTGTALPAVFGNVEVGSVTATGNVESDGTLGADGDFRIGSAGANNFTIAAASGNTSIAGTLDITGVTSFTNKIDLYNNAAPTDGQLLIGHTSNGTFEAATLTEGSNGVTITNAGGSITIDNDLATTTTVGVASFNADNFTVTTGDVTITAIDGGTY